MKLVINYNLNLIEVIYVMYFLIVIASTTINNQTLNPTWQIVNH